MSEKQIVEELNSAQESALDEYAEKYTKHGLSLEPVDHAKAAAAFAKAYTLQGMTAPALVEWLPSPFAMLLRGATLELTDELVTQGKSRADSEKEASAMFDVGKTFNEDAQRRIRDLLNHCCFGQHDAGWLSWVQFFRSEVGLQEETDELLGVVETAEHAHWWLPFENACLASERPIECHLSAPDAQGLRVLHRDGGPAIRYADGFSLYCLNGVDVPRGIVETPAEKLSAKLVLTEKNAEIRRELVRKMGIDRILGELNAKAVDKKDGYELLELDLGDGRRRPFLKMKNPSIEAVHVEGVHPDCKTVHQALAWRNGLDIFEAPQVLT